MTDESGFRKQQEKCKAGELSNDRKNKLTAVLRSDWESDNITTLRSCVRAGDIGIKQMGLTDALAELESKTDGIRY